MQIVTLDFETYFDQDYSLSKLSTEEYVRDPRFEVHGVAVKLQEPIEWMETNRHGHYCNIVKKGTTWLPEHTNNFDPDNINFHDCPAGDFLTSVSWKETACLCHHAQFDGLILSHHYGIQP